MSLADLEVALSTGKTIYFVGYRINKNDRLHIAKDEKGKYFYTDFSKAQTAKQAYSKKHNTNLEVMLKKLIPSEVQVSKE